MDYSFRGIRLAQSAAQSASELQGIIICPKVHEEQMRRIVKHVTVQGGHSDPVRAQSGDDRIDLGGQQNKVAGNCRAA